MQPASDGSYDLDEAAAPQQPWELVDALRTPPTRAQERRVVDEVTASASSLGRELARDAAVAPEGGDVIESDALRWLCRVLGCSRGKG